MLILALDTSSPAVTVALVGPPPAASPPTDFSAGKSANDVGAAGQVVERTVVATNRHGELLAPLIDDVLAEFGAFPGDLTAIGVGLGPGPFTGLRVGIMTAKAMGDALGIPVYGACSLDAMASRISTLAYDGDDDHGHELVVMSDARRKQVYWARYSITQGRLTDPEISRPEQLASELAGGICHVGGAGALLYRDRFDGFDIIESEPYPAAQEIAGLVSLKALQRREGDDLTPLYLRRPDAVPRGLPKQVTPS